MWTLCSLWWWYSKNSNIKASKWWIIDGNWWKDEALNFWYRFTDFEWLWFYSTYFLTEFLIGFKFHQCYCNYFSLVSSHFYWLKSFCIVFCSVCLIPKFVQQILLLKWKVWKFHCVIRAHISAHSNTNMDIRYIVSIFKSSHLMLNFHWHLNYMYIIKGFKAYKKT